PPPGLAAGNRNRGGGGRPGLTANSRGGRPLVVAFAIAGTVEKDLAKEPLGQTDNGADVYLRDIWPTMNEISSAMRDAFDAETYRKLYGNFAEQNPLWNSIPTSSGLTYQWDGN